VKEPSPSPPKVYKEPSPSSPKVDYDCVDRHYKKASKENTVNSFRNFLRKCTDKNNANYITATQKLKNIQIKVTASPPKVISQSEKPQTIIIPTGSLGEMSEARIKILEKTLESKLDDHFAIVPKELFEEAQEQAFQEMESDECTEDQCILMIKEILQIENAFKMDLISEDGDTQISITWNDQDQKRVEEDYCEGCKTKGLRLMIGGLVEKLVKGNN
jgi:serine/threonine protein kinase